MYVEYKVRIIPKQQQEKKKNLFGRKGGEMAKKNAIILCLFLVLFVFVAAGGEAKKHIKMHHNKVVHLHKTHETCKETWETTCVLEDDCNKKCFHDHGKQATTQCLVQEGPTGGDLCVCNYAC
ncbi:hypothetical protein C5167_030314 [Papaver somniferum]|nr:hypothetical protein C5167_030314 [Papaver somniferum]